MSEGASNSNFRQVGRKGYPHSLKRLYVLLLLLETLQQKTKMVEHKKVQPTTVAQKKVKVKKVFYISTCIVETCCR